MHPTVPSFARSVVALTLAALALVVAPTPPADATPAAPPAPAAPTACPQPVADRYEPGDEVVIVGYTEGCVPNLAEDGALRTQPLYGYLHRDSCPESFTTTPCGRIDDPTSGTPVGRFNIEDTPHRPRGFRMRLRFTLPDDLVPDAYFVLLSEDPPVTGLVYGQPQPLYVGVDPPAHSPVRGWPLDDPAIDNLADDALLLGVDGNPITAAEVRAIPPDERGQLGDRADAAGQPDLGEDDVAIADDSTAAPDDSDDEGHGNPLGPTAVALGIGAAALAAWVAVSRRGDGRKQIRRAPPRL